MAIAAEPAFVEMAAAIDGEKSLNKRPPSTDSRSTSAGSSPALSVSVLSEEGSPAKVNSPLNEYAQSSLPDYEYPVPFAIRNTFIDMGVPRPISLEDFIEERRVHSCPVQPPPGLVPAEQPSLHATVAAAAASAAASAAAAAAASLCFMQRSLLPPLPAAGAPEWPPYSSPMAGEGTPSSMLFPMAAPRGGLEAAPGGAAPPAILRLADALSEPELGSAGMPTKGSAGHWSGSCKPCAFFHTKGCGNGVDCQFCHLCPAGEKKRRQKEKVAVTREMRQWGLLPEE